MTSEKRYNMMTALLAIPTVGFIILFIMAYRLDDKRNVNTSRLADELLTRLEREV